MFGWERLIPLAAFSGAALVFLVQPLLGRLLLPSLGGAPAVWNTSLVFFQTALLAGYAYAHALQRFGPVRRQALAHTGLLAVAALSLPLGVSPLLGPPDVERPAGWLLATLTLSVGAPFIALSATAPLIQAWWAAARGARDPYPLYAASNLGSLGALLAYPLIVEPALGLDAQRWGWTAAYAAFAMLMVAVWRSLPRPKSAAAYVEASPPIRGRWRQRLWWAFLGAVPPSLLLGVTAHIATDVASAPLLWIAPLALYLATFVIAFSNRGARWRRPALAAQALLTPAALVLVAFPADWLWALPAHLAAFAAAALVCHQRLAADRPPPERLTEFYLALAVGGAVGGGLTALAAPLLFDAVWEHPAALILAVLARPWSPGRPRGLELAAVAAIVVAALLVLTAPPGPPAMEQRVALMTAAVATLALHGRSWLLAPALALVAGAAHAAAQVHNDIRVERSFFGVHRVSLNSVPGLGPVRFLSHGVTLHGAQSAEPGQDCRPLTYYAPRSPIAQAIGVARSRGPLRIGVMGLGAGAVAALADPADRVAFHEIDPVVVDLARTSFTYLDACASGRAKVKLGDARLTVAAGPPAAYDVLLADAFSSDAVPTHLLTVEAMAVWLRALERDGLLLVHVSNRNLELEGPVAAALRAHGLTPLSRLRVPPEGAPPLSESTSRVVAASRDPDVLRRLRALGWRDARSGVAPWTDDRSDLLGAVLRKRSGG